MSFSLPHSQASVSIRKLTACDEDQFINLLRAVYGDTYSYHFLYEPGGLSSLIKANQLTSYGEFDSHDRLLSHTAFWHVEKNSDFVESGCSFRLSGGLKEFKSTMTPRAWHDELQRLATQYSFIHQHNSTLHVLSQRYAQRLMGAKYCGLILGYSANEKVKGVLQQTNKMHALIMTSILQTQITEKKIYTPAMFQPWLTDIYKHLGLPRCIVGLGQSNTNQLITLKTIESNPYISLQRRMVEASQLQEDPPLPRSQLRTDLIHLPLEQPELVDTAFPLLIQSGYFPCGIRPHVDQSDELIFQNLIGYEDEFKNLSDVIKIANPHTKREVEQWQMLVLQIM